MPQSFKMAFSYTLTMRYERQLFFKFIGKEGQEKIREGIVTIVGVGSLGSISAELLARAGIGKLILIDDDTVELHNLQRQSLYDENDIGKKKVIAAKDHLSKINREVEIEIHDSRIDENNAELLNGIVIDGTDNMKVRYVMNRYCKSNKIPLIYGAIASSFGMVYFINEGPCLECILPHTVPSITCEADGVINTISYITASLQANQALKYIVGDKVEDSLISVNVWENDLKKIKVKSRIDCPVCSGKDENIELEKFIIRPCKNKAAFSLRERQQQKIDIEKVRKLMDTVSVETKVALIGNIDQEEIIIHPHGEILFKKCRDKEKMRMIASKLFA